MSNTVRWTSALCAGAIAAGATGTAEARELIYGSWIPQAEYTNSVALPKAFEEIAAETDGEIEWRLVPGGQLVDATETWDALESGLIQGGMGLPAYVPSVVPTLNLLYQTVLPGDDVLAAGGAVLETMLLDCPQCLEELRDLNMVAIAGWDTAPYHLGCTEPVETVDDIAGLRVRAVGGNVRLMEAAGATPVAATLVEAINLLQTGGIECVFGTSGWYRSFGYADFITHHNDYPMGMTGPAAGWLVNRDAWQSMTPEQQELHLRKGAMVSAMQIIGQFVEEEQEALDWAVSEKGVTMIEPEGEAAEAFASLMEEFVAAQEEAVVADAASMGVEEPGAIINAYRENYEKWQGMTGEIGTDIDAFTQLLWDEVYSRIDPAAL